MMFNRLLIALLRLKKKPQPVSPPMPHAKPVSPPMPHAKPVSPRRPIAPTASARGYKTPSLYPVHEQYPYGSAPVLFHSGGGGDFGGAGATGSWDDPPSHSCDSPAPSPSCDSGSSYDSGSSCSSDSSPSSSD